MSLSFDQREIFEGLSSVDIGSSVSVRGELEIITALTLKKLLNDIGKEHFYIMHLSWGGKDRQRLWDIAARKCDITQLLNKEADPEELPPHKLLTIMGVASVDAKIAENGFERLSRPAGTYGSIHSK